MTCTNRDSARLEAAISRFPRTYRRRLRKLTSLSSRLGDLLVSFPGVAFALVSGFSTPETRGEAVRLVRAGGGLKDIADVLGLPMWLKRLPPEAFHEPLQHLPRGRDFALRLGNAVPADPATAAVWLHAVMYGHMACHEAFALWLAKQRAAANRFAMRLPLRPLAAFAWYSDAAKVDARDLIDRPWSDNMKFKTAVDQTGIWIDRLSAAATPMPRRRGPGRYSQRFSTGYRIVPLRTGAELREEGRCMNHCVGSYAHDVARGDCWIFSVRFGAERLATLEVVAGHGENAGRPLLAQLQGPRNTRVSYLVERMVGKWIDQQRLPPKQTIHNGDLVPFEALRWEELWTPYIAQKRAEGHRVQPWSLHTLQEDAFQLAQVCQQL